jgi:hypothetical protein
MNLEHVLAELRRERDAIDAAIVSLERLGYPGKTEAHRLSDSPAKSYTAGANGSFRNLTPEESS